MKVWKVEEGPTHVDDMYEDFPSEVDLWILTCLVELDDGEISYEEFLFETLDSAYKFQNKVSYSKEPVELSF